MAVRKLILILAVALVSVARRAEACAACNCGDATLTMSGVEKPYRNRVRLSLEERAAEGRSGGGVDAEESWTLRSSLTASWSPVARVTLAAMLPLVTRWVMPARGAKEVINGLGDLEVLGRVILYRERRFAPQHLLWATGGIKTPTGPRLRDDAGFPYPEDEQPGSGSWDPFAGLSYGWFGGNVALFGATSYRFTTAGTRGYQRGSVLLASTAAQVSPWPWAAATLGVDAIWSQADSLQNRHDAPNTGGFALHLTPGILITPRTDLLLRLAVEIPAVQVLNGIQSEGPQAIFSIVYDVR
jgi:hypothetical protein